LRRLKRAYETGEELDPLNDEDEGKDRAWIMARIEEAKLKRKQDRLIYEEDYMSVSSVKSRDRKPKRGYSELSKGASLAGGPKSAGGDLGLISSKDINLNKKPLANAKIQTKEIGLGPFADKVEA
jgi:hypothetical protein